MCRITDEKQSFSMPNRNWSAVEKLPKLNVCCLSAQDLEIARLPIFADVLE